MHKLKRNYNEDRVTAIPYLEQPKNKRTAKEPYCSFFGLYDGHGGAACADFLRDNLHQFIVRESCFPANPESAIRKGFEAAEREFIRICQSKTKLVEKSGSCAVVALIVGKTCYVANVGDSRAVLSMYLLG